MQVNCDLPETFPALAVPGGGVPGAEPAFPARPVLSPAGRAPRPAWIEVDLQRLRTNYRLISEDKPPGLKLLAVVKDDGYGHGGLAVATAALEAGATWLAVSTVEEGVRLRDGGIKAPILMLGDRQPEELPWCLASDLVCCLSDLEQVDSLAGLARRVRRRVPVQIKINTGMNRYGVRWTRAPELAARVAAEPALFLQGVLSHFAQSEETDKSHARLQEDRFREALAGISQRGIPVPCRHLCNSGGFLDLPGAHFDMVRLGILPLGVFPSAACRRVPGILPVMTVKARIAAFQMLEPGDCVGYGMRFTATARRRVAVLPLGYGDGFPRLHNQGAALIRGRRAPLVGCVSMDALTVDVTDIPQATVGDEAVLMGRQGTEEISAFEIALLKHSITYEVLTGWHPRLPRLYSGPDAEPASHGSRKLAGA